MAKIIFSLLIALLSRHTLAQENPLLGDWKVVAVDNGEFYWNIELDSLSLTDGLKLRYSEPLKVENLKKMANMIYIEQTFTFTADGQFIQKNQISPLHSFYKIDPKTDSLLIYESELQQDPPDFLICYQLKDNRLYLELKVTEPPLKFELKR